MRSAVIADKQRRFLSSPIPVVLCTVETATETGNRHEEIFPANVVTYEQPRKGLLCFGMLCGAGGELTRKERNGILLFVRSVYA